MVVAMGPEQATICATAGLCARTCITIIELAQRNVGDESGGNGRREARKARALFLKIKRRIRR